MYSVTQTGLSVEQTIWTVWTFSTNTKYHLIAEQTINIFYTNSRSSLTQIISDSLITSQLHIYLTLALSARKIEFWRKKKEICCACLHSYNDLILFALNQWYFVHQLLSFNKQRISWSQAAENLQINCAKTVNKCLTFHNRSQFYFDWS